MTGGKCAVYILTNKTRSVLYIGVTRNLAARMDAHKRGAADGFAKKYACYYLVYVAFFDDWGEAVVWEKRLKKWERIWKDDLICKENPQWRDLSADI